MTQTYLKIEDTTTSLRITKTIKNKILLIKDMLERFSFRGKPLILNQKEIVKLLLLFIDEKYLTTLSNVRIEYPTIEYPTIDYTTYLISNETKSLFDSFIHLFNFVAITEIVENNQNYLILNSSPNKTVKNFKTDQYMRIIIALFKNQLKNMSNEEINVKFEVILSTF